MFRAQRRAAQAHPQRLRPAGLAPVGDVGRGPRRPGTRYFGPYSHAWAIRDTLDTAAAFGFAPAGGSFGRRQLGPAGFDTIIEMWLPLAWSLNMVNRSMGHADLYPFVLAPAVLEKMRFVHIVVDEVTAG